MWPSTDLRDIRVFLVVAEELHFGRAADRLGITNSRASQMIRTLEAQIGARLFDRTSRRVSLTPLGARLLAEIRPTYEQLERMLREVREAANGIAGTLRVGSYLALNLGPHWVRIVSAFERENPSCHVEFIDTGTQHSYLDLLRSGELDMVASRLPLQQPDLTIGPVLSHEDRVLIIAEDDPLARQEAVCVDDFAEHAVVGQGAGMPSEMVDAFIPPVSPSGRRMRRVPPISFEEVRLRVACGELVHATVRSAVAYWSHPTTTSLPIRDLPPSQTALVWVSANRSPKVEAFAAAASRVLATTELASCQPAATIRSRAA